MTEVLIERIAILETKLESYARVSEVNQAALMASLQELKQGLGQRVEEHGSDIAVLKSKHSDNLDKIKNLESSRTWVILAIIGSFFSAIWALIVGKKST